VRTMPTLVSSALTALADDVVASSWLLPEGDPLRQYLSMLATLPAEEEAWLEVLVPWAAQMRRGWDPGPREPVQLAAVGALAVSALRAAKELPAESALARHLHGAARWAFWLVRPDAR
jgi:hypothetical protein